MEWDLILRLCVAGLCGTVLGLDREYRVKDAGFRTHFLVALGSALMMIVSQYGFEGFLATHDGLRLDPSRIAAQVVSGIGFIGAGTIIIHRQLVRDLRRRPVCGPRRESDLRPEDICMSWPEPPRCLRSLRWRC